MLLDFGIRPWVEVKKNNNNNRTSWSGRPFVPIKVVVEVHNTIIANCKKGRQNLNVQKSTILKILRSVLRIFPYRFQLWHASSGGRGGEDDRDPGTAKFFSARRGRLSGQIATWKWCAGGREVSEKNGSAGIFVVGTHRIWASPLKRRFSAEMW